MTNSYAGKVIRGGAWILGLRLSSRAAGFVRTIILARLLTPSQFGIVAIATLVISMVEMFTQPGFGPALVQKEKGVSDYLDTLWTFSIIRSIFIFCILYLSAPFLADFFEAPSVIWILRVFAVSVIITGSRNPGVVYFARELDFKKQYLYEFAQTAGNLAIAIPAALMFRNEWALVAGGMAGALVRFTGSYWLQGYRPRFSLEKEKLVEMFRYGRWIMLSSMLAFLVAQGDDLLVGKWLGTTALGIYQMAYMVSNLPTTETARVLANVTFPAYSRFQSDHDRLHAAYEKVVRAICLLSFCFAGFIFLFTRDVISLLVTEKWLATVPVIRIMVWSGLLKAIADTAVPLFNALGIPKRTTKWQMVGLFVLVTAIVPLIRQMGLIGVALAVLASDTVFAMGVLWDVKGILRYGASHWAKNLSVPLAGLFSGMLLAGLGPPSALLLGPVGETVGRAILFFFGYGAGILLLEPLTAYGTGAIIRSMLTSFRGR